MSGRRADDTENADARAQKRKVAQAAICRPPPSKSREHGHGHTQCSQFVTYYTPQQTHASCMMRTTTTAAMGDHALALHSHTFNVTLPKRSHLPRYCRTSASTHTPATQTNYTLHEATTAFAAGSHARVEVATGGQHTGVEAVNAER